MTDEELKEILGEMKGDVTNPELCNIPIPDMNQAVRAGTPTVCGDTPRDECVFLSKSFLNFGVTFTLDVIGDSMMDIGIMRQTPDKILPLRRRRRHSGSGSGRRVYAKSLFPR